MSQPPYRPQPTQQWPPPPAPPAPPAKRRGGAWKGFGLFVAGGFLGIMIGSAGHGAVTSSATPAYTSPSQATIAAPAPAPAAPAPKPAAPNATVGDGVYQVGPDMPAGRYKTAGGGDNLFGCYWERDRNDSGQFDAIISNDVFKGPGSVTVKAGEFAKLSGGCTWTKQ